MRDRSLYRLGGVCSVLVALSYVVIGVTQLMLPHEYTAENNARLPILFFEPNRMLFMTQWAAMAWGAVFALAVVPAISQRVRDLNEGWVRWTGTLAMLGFMVTIFDNYWALVWTDAISKAYTAGNEVARTAFGLPGYAQQIDVKGWLQYGAVGFWVLVVNLLAWRANAWQRPLAMIGVVVGLAYLTVVVSNVVPNTQVLSVWIAGLGGVVLGPIWYAWIGIDLFRMPVEPNSTAAALAGKMAAEL